MNTKLKTPDDNSNDKNYDDKAGDNLLNKNFCDDVYTVDSY